MIPGALSRYAFCRTVALRGQQALTDRAPYRFRVLSDTRQHVVKRGHTLRYIAELHYRAMTKSLAGDVRASDLWHVIADFQPSPIVDPTVPLTVGRVLFIPSTRTVLEDIFSENRRLEHQ